MSLIPRISLDESTNTSTMGDHVEVTSELRRQGVNWLRRLDMVTKICVIAALVAFVATIVLLGLAIAEYVFPLIPLYAFGGSIALLIISKMIDCCQQSVAEHYKIPHDDYIGLKNQPDPKPPQDLL